MASFAASAPCKAIMFGEHYVVYGAPALAVAIEPRNSILFSPWEGSGIALKSALGNATVSPAGRYDGPDDLGIYAEVAGSVFGSAPIPPCTAEFMPVWKLKGVGTSASLCAAFAAGLFRLKGETADAERIFSAAQAGDLVAHGGKASGIDAKTVSYGKPLVFQRSFSPPKYGATPAGFSLPSGTKLLLVDTNAGKKDGTGKMVGIFASQFGISSAPQDAPEEKRAEVRGEYSLLWEKVSAAMKKADAKTIGELMNENHALLRGRNVSSAGIEKAVSAALSAGALGAKLTGGGGEGGAVLALCSGKSEKAVKKGMAALGFACHPLSLARKGACAD